MIRTSALAVSALLVLFHVPVASAADIDVPGETMGEMVFEEPPQIPVFTWTGAYAGVQLAYGFGRERTTAALPGGALRTGLSPSGAVGGGHIGYMLSTQSLPALGPAFAGAENAGVVGLEADIDGTRIDAHKRDVPPVGAVATRSDVEGSIRGRLGVASRRVLVYATGGVSFAAYDTKAGGANATHTRVGPTVGGGIEYALLNTLSLRAEYRYTDFGRFTDTASVGGVPVPLDRHDTVTRLQAGVSYRFGSPVTPAATD